MFIDFTLLKQQITAEAVVQALAFGFPHTKDGWRGPCPVCASSDQRALVVSEAKQFYCFAAKKGGDLISLVMHVRNLQTKAAAQWLQDNALNGGEPAQEPKEQEQQAAPGFKPLTYLQHDHEAVIQSGIHPIIAKQLGIGYAPKGIHRGRIALPLYCNGSLVGYVGIKNADIKWPPFKEAENATTQ